MATFWEKITFFICQYLPSFVAGLTFLPCGLVFGYTITSFVVERNNNEGVITYGPMIFGGCFAFIFAVALVILKYVKGRIVFIHFEVLLVAGAFNLIASAFYFADSFDHVGAFISFLAHALTFIAALSYLHVISGKVSRSIFLSLCFVWYLLGLASAVSLIGTSYSKKKAAEDNPSDVNVDGIYVNFAAVYLSISIIMIAILSGVKVLHFLGNVDYKTCMDNDFRIANSNGSVFDKRDEILKRVQFFYVTKSRQWSVSLIVLFIDAIDYAIFIYFVFWFSLNDAVRLTSEDNIAIMFWVIFAGSCCTPISLIFFSVKTNFVATKIVQIILTFLSMILFGLPGQEVPFWLILFLCGMSFSNLKMSVIELSHFRFSELLIFGSYFTKLLTTSVVYYYFVVNSRNSYFYSTDGSTLMAQAFVFIIIAALVTIVVSMQVPRTHKTSLFDIQYGLLGVIFQKHQIEQLNVKWLNDGTIPTVSRSSIQP